MRTFLICFFIVLCACGENEKCGEIYDKVSRNGRYFFIFDANFSYDVSTSNDIASFVPDNRLSGEVSQSVYNQFSIGEEYCQ